MPRRVRVLLWTETYQAGGADRYLVDLAGGLDPDRWSWRWAGNPLPALDAYLEVHRPEALPRRTLAVANLREPALGKAVRAVRGQARAVSPAAPPAADGEQGAAGPAVVIAGMLRTQQAATNFVRLRRLLRRERPDVLHVNNGGYPGAESCRIICLAARAEGIPRIVHFVHNMAYEPVWPTHLERALDRRVDAAVDAWATAAHRASERLAAARDIRPDGIHTVHYGLPERADAPSGTPMDRLRDELGFVPDEAGLLVVAAFEPRKGHAVLIDALAELAARGVPVRAALAGTGAQQEAVREQVTAHGLGDRVRLLGWRDDVDALMSASDALVLPSLGNECLPYAILEAMEHALPVVATDVAGIPEEVEDGITGRVVPPGDSVALAAAIAELADPALRRTWGVAGRRRLDERFRLDRMVERTTALWAQPGVR